MEQVPLTNTTDMIEILMNIINCFQTKAEICSKIYETFSTYHKVLKNASQGQQLKWKQQNVF